MNDFVECTEFRGLMDTGSSRPFLATTAAGEEWIIKWLGNPQGSKSVFNELVAGRLATLVGLPWPTVEIAVLSSTVLAALESNDLRASSAWAVGLKYIHHLRPIPWPPGGFTRGVEFPKRNAEHILRVFPRTASREALYGKMLFDNWLILRDTKYDTLYIDPSGGPFFLDGSNAFGGSEWNLENLVWRDTAIDIQSPYLEGVLTEYDRYGPWLQRLKSLALPDLEACFAGLPAEWDVAKDYVARSRELVSSTSRDFVPMVQQWIEWEQMTGA